MPEEKKKNRRWKIDEKIRKLKEPFSETSVSSVVISSEPLTRQDVIEHPENHMKGGK